MINAILSVGVGGFLGAVTRYFLAGWVTHQLLTRWGIAFPLGTMFVNVCGSFLLGLFLAWGATRIELSDQTRLLIGAGFFGAFTTFSTFANESLDLFLQGRQLAFWGNVFMTNILCIAGAMLGVLIANRLWATT